jgi:hypothetical protein
MLPSITSFRESSDREELSIIFDGWEVSPCGAQISERGCHPPGAVAISFAQSRPWVTGEDFAEY